MKTNGTNPGVNVDEYENMAVQNSNNVKRALAVGGALVGAAAIGGGGTYAATHMGTEPAEAPLTGDEIDDGANVATTYQEEAEETQAPVVKVEKPAEPAEPDVAWESRTSDYIDGERIHTVEEGRVDGHKFQLIDENGDDVADEIRIDANDNGIYESNESVKLTAYDNVKIGHDVKVSHERHFELFETENESDYVAEDIHNDYTDEKTGESYHEDYAENNPDYNSDADTDYYTASVNEEEIQNDDINDYGGEEFLG